MLASLLSFALILFPQPTVLRTPAGQAPGSSLDGLNAAVAAQRAALLGLARIADAQRAAQARAQARAQAPRPTPTPVRAAGVAASGAPSAGCAVADIIRSVWTRDAEWAIGIAMRESHCQAGARNPSGANGIFQLLGHHDLFPADCQDEFNATCNIRAAWTLYQGSGRSPWSY